MPWFLNPNIYHKLPIYQNPELYLFILKIAVTATFALFLWKQGIRRHQLLAVTYIFFYGVFLTVMLFMHNIVILGLRIFERTTGNFSYDFHLYSLILLGSILFSQGVRLLHSAFRLKAQDKNGIYKAKHATWIVLAVTIPLIPIQFFGVVLTILSVVNLAVIKLLLERSAVKQQNKSEETVLTVSNLSFDN
jgi:hypothetical protein